MYGGMPWVVRVWRPLQLHYSFAELRRVASEECPTGIGELSSQRRETTDINKPSQHIYRSTHDRQSPMKNLEMKFSLSELEFRFV